MEGLKDEYWKDLIVYCSKCGGCKCHTCNCPGGPCGPKLHTRFNDEIHTETTSKVTETINSIDYNTGWQYSVTGSNVDNNGENLNPGNTTGSTTVNPLGATEGTITSTNSSADLSNMNFKITNPGEAFQFTQTYQGPGVTNQTVIQRITEVTSVTDTTSIFTQ